MQPQPSSDASELLLTVERAGLETDRLTKEDSGTTKPVFLSPLLSENRNSDWKLIREFVVFTWIDIVGVLKEQLLLMRTDDLSVTSLIDFLGREYHLTLRNYPFHFFSMVNTRLLSESRGPFEKSHLRPAPDVVVGLDFVCSSLVIHPEVS